MTLEELDVALEELEIRLERLRALYEQYFLGFEKVEPGVARKDVDRRIYVLRREKIRNTGKRFKLQTLIQRYNTFQQYWQRICREIENGTYRRQIARAGRRMGEEEILTIAARRRFGRASADRAATEAPSLDSIDDDAIEEIEPEEQVITQVGLGPPSPSEPSPPPLPRKSPRPPVVTRSARAGARYESLDLDMDFLSDWDPLGVRKPSPAGAPNSSVARERPKPAGKPSPPAQAASRSVPATKPARSGKSLPPPARRTAPPPRAEKSSPKAARSAPSPRLTDDRIRELHGRLSELKEKNQEAGRVSMERLAKTLRATEEKLRAEHKNRSIDFEVVIRDGKAVVKPTVR